VHGFTRTLAKEVGQHGITVNCAAPYGTVSEDPEAFSRGSRFHPESDFFHKLAESDPEDRAKMRRPGGVLPRDMALPEEVAGAVLYLASASAAFVTGQVLPIEGGTLL
jgi:NAD(P)-dependent dehydrogenase (short-subunit alcohol dehydrogenase family)